MNRRHILTMMLAMPFATRLHAAPAPAKPFTFEDGPIEQLKPGEYFWAPQIAPQGPVTMIVSLRTQRAYVYRNGVPIGVSTVSTGKKGHETPTGIFTILQKKVDHKSNLYNDAPMPFMQRLTWDGIALHAGNLPGYPASHGCVRLPYDFAKLLYGVTQLGLTVIITNDPLVPEVSPVAAAGSLGLAGGAGEGSSYYWQPEASPTGPISIVVSGRDRRLVVLRNGKEIGASSLELDVPVTTTSAFTLRAIDAEGTHWMRLPLPGMPSPGDGELSPEERARGRVPEAFHEAVVKVLQPGTTLLVTRESLATSGTGTQIRVVDVDRRR